MIVDSKEILKNRILQKAKEEFAKHGYSKVKTETIASLLGISKRTLYELFASKELLLNEILELELANAKIEIDTIISHAEKPDADFIEIIRNLWGFHCTRSITFTKEFFEDLKKYAPDQWKKIEDFRIMHLKTDFSKLHLLGVKNGYIKEHIDKDVFYLIFYNAFTNIMTPEIISELPITTKQVIENIIDVLFTGSLTDKGRDAYICCNETNNFNN